jgi:hypothetical protein
MDYLGAMLNSDVSNSSELSRRIGMAKADILTLSKVWGHAALTRMRKLYIYTALIESKLLYSVSSMCLSIAEQRKLDGFQNRCLRRIVGIKPAYFFRVSNATVLEKSGHIAATKIIQKKQMQLLGKVLCAPGDNTLRSVSFTPGTLRPATDRYVRRRGPPHKEWIPEAMKLACQIFGSSVNAERVAANKCCWDNYLETHFKF